MVLFFLAAAAAFLIFFLAAPCCFLQGMRPPFLVWIAGGLDGSNFSRLVGAVPATLLKAPGVRRRNFSCHGRYLVLKGEQ